MVDSPVLMGLTISKSSISSSFSACCLRWHSHCWMLALELFLGMWGSTGLFFSQLGDTSPPPELLLNGGKSNLGGVVVVSEGDGLLSRWVGRGTDQLFTGESLGRATLTCKMIDIFNILKAVLLNILFNFPS